MLKISKQNNALIVIGENNDFYVNNGQNSYPLNSLIVVTDNSDMATFRSVATNDVLFSGLINNITINGEAVTKDNIIEKFDAVSNSSTGGGGVDAYTKTESDAKYATKDELTAVEAVADDAVTKAEFATTIAGDAQNLAGKKQDILVSGTNIKTVNSQSILGSGDLTISGVSDEQAQEIAKIPTLETELAQKANVSDVPTVQTGRNGTNKNYVYSNADSSKDNDKVVSDCIFINNAIDRLDFFVTYWGDGGPSKFTGVPLATPETAGIMSGNDKTKLDSIPENIPTQTEVDNIAANVSALETSLGNKQDTLVSGTNIKTVNSQSILGEGNIEVSGVSDEQAQEIAKIPTIETELNNKQDTLVSGTNIKTINSQSILGEGNIEITGGDVDLTNYYTKTETDTKLDTKQNTLVSGENIKTINSESILGTGDIQINAGAKLVNVGNAPFSNFYNLLSNAVSALNNGTDYTDTFMSMNETICKQYYDLFNTLKNGDLLSQYDNVFGDIFKVECNPFAFKHSEGNNAFNIPIKYLGNFSSNNYINYTRDIYVHFYFYKTSSGEIGQVELKVYTKKAGPTLQKNDFKTINGESVLGEGNIEVTIPDATTTTSGAMSAADKTKLDSISNEWTGTQSEFDALTTKDNNIIYYITE